MDLLSVTKLVLWKTDSLKSVVLIMKKHFPLLHASPLFEHLPLSPLANVDSLKWMLKNAFLNGELEEEFTCVFL